MTSTVGSSLVRSNLWLLRSLSLSRAGPQPIPLLNFLNSSSPPQTMQSFPSTFFSSALVFCSAKTLVSIIYLIKTNNSLAILQNPFHVTMLNGKCVFSWPSHLMNVKINEIRNTWQDWVDQIVEANLVFVSNIYTHILEDQAAHPPSHTPPLPAPTCFCLARKSVILIYINKIPWYYSFGFRISTHPFRMC